MIVKVDSDFLDCPESELKDKFIELCNIAEAGHYLDVDNNIEGDFVESLQKYAGDTYCSFIAEAMQKFSYEKSIRSFLTTIKFSDYTREQRRCLLQKPSELLLENSANEWDIYRSLIYYYSKGQNFKNVMSYLQRSIKRGMIEPAHLGGIYQLPAELKQKEGKYKNMYRHKVCVVFDRDTDNSDDIDKTKKAVFSALCNGIDINQVNNDLIYRLDYEDEYVWHMWYKRAIENYFPKEQYESLGVDVSSFDDQLPYDYQKFDEKKDYPKGYKKNMMNGIAKRMTRQYFEENTHHFKITGEDMSEIQLLLLKIAKIV